MYSKVYCPYCIKAKNALNQFIKADQYKVVEVSRQASLRLCCDYGMREDFCLRMPAHGPTGPASVCLLRCPWATHLVACAADPNLLPTLPVPSCHSTSSRPASLARTFCCCMLPPHALPNGPSASSCSLPPSLGGSKRRTGWGQGLSSRRHTVLLPHFPQQSTRRKPSSLPPSFPAPQLDQRQDIVTMQDALGEITGGRTVPRVFINGKFLGGGDDTVAAAANGTLEKLLKEAGVL